MRKIFFVIPIVTMCLFARFANAGESIPLALNAPKNITQDACKVPVWKGLAVFWGGVKDKRQAPEIGVQTQKGKEPIPVISNPPLEELFNTALKDMFASCGMKFVSKDGDSILKLSAEIRDFYVGVEKKLLTGKSEAKSSIAFLTLKENQSSSVTVGYEIESKKIRSGDIKQLQKTLDELFAETIKQIPKTQEMKELK